MDNSPEYIAMSDCPEIQDGWKPECGDVVAYRNINIVSILDGQSKDHATYTYLWLPYQHQLQGMLSVQSSYKDPLHLFCNTHSTICQEHEYYGALKSMEQLWLAFVMHKLHQKKWSGIETRWTKQ